MFLFISRTFVNFKKSFLLFVKIFACRKRLLSIFKYPKQQTNFKSNSFFQSGQNKILSTNIITKTSDNFGELIYSIEPTNMIYTYGKQP